MVHKSSEMLPVRGVLGSTRWQEAKGPGAQGWLHTDAAPGPPPRPSLPEPRDETSLLQGATEASAEACPCRLARVRDGPGVRLCSRLFPSCVFKLWTSYLTRESVPFEKVVLKLTYGSLWGLNEMMSAKPKGTELMAWEPKMKMWAGFMQALVQFITQTPQILSVKI